MTQDILEQQAALLALITYRPGGSTVRKVMTEILRDDDPLSVWDALSPSDLFGGSDELSTARSEIEGWRRSGLQFTSILDTDYPARLRGVYDAPPFLFFRGDLSRADGGVSVVGSRDASRPALERAGEIAKLLVRRHIPVISGLARGVDSAAHEAALSAGGMPVGVIATGIGAQYTPAESRLLHERVAKAGVLISQFMPMAHAQKHTFLMRNATMSGLGLATIVVEAGEHSGARAQARLAMEHGRPVLLTHSVIERTQWGRSMADGSRPNVYPVHSLADVDAALDQIAWASSQEVWDQLLASA